MDRNAPPKKVVFYKWKYFFTQYRIHISKHDKLFAVIHKLLDIFTEKGKRWIEIVKFRKGDDDKDLAVNGKTPYFRILIKKLS